MEHFFTVLDRIREKPEATRWAVTVLIAALVLLFLLVFWAWNLSRQFADLSRGEEEASGGNLSAVLSPFQSLKETVNAVSQGEDPAKAAERLRSETRAGEEEEPGRFRKALQGFGGIVRYNWGLIKETF